MKNNKLKIKELKVSSFVTMPGQIKGGVLIDSDSYCDSGLPNCAPTVNQLCIPSDVCNF